MYASWTGYSWNIQTVDSKGFEGSLALDSAGNPHVAYFASGNGGTFLKYASWIGSSWRSEIIDTGSMTYTPSLKIDAQNHPHIMYEINTILAPNNSSVALKYAASNSTSSGWTIQTIGQNTGFRGFVLDSRGHPHFSLITKEGIADASWNGSALNMQTTNVNAVSGESYLALDKHDYPHIAFINSFSSETGAEMYAGWNGTAWDIQTLDSNPQSTGPLAIDSNGNPHLLYFKTGSGGNTFSLMYATTAGSTQTSITPLSTVIVIAIPLIVILSVLALVYLFRKKTKNLV